MEAQRFRGKNNVVVSFHPLDWTPTCSAQVPAFDSDRQKFAAVDAQVVDISVDSIPSKIAWQKKEIGILHTPMCADFYPHGEVARSSVFSGRTAVSRESASEPCSSWIRAGRSHLPRCIRWTRRRIMRSCWRHLKKIDSQRLVLGRKVRPISQNRPQRQQTKGGNHAQRCHAVNAPNPENMSFNVRKVERERQRRQ